MKKDNIVIELKNIEKNYFLKNNKIEVLQNINVEFEKGKFYAIMGHSGSGKSTLFNIIGLMDNKTSGTYILDGINIDNLNDKIAAELRKLKIGFIFQDFYLDEYLKAKENVMLPMMINKNIAKDKQIKLATKLLREVDLIDRIDHFPKELSGGEKQRVAIARALANNPDIILADEPTGDLDEKNEKKIFEILKNLTKNGKCVIVVSHSNDVKSYADVIYKLKDGILESEKR